MLKNPLPNWEPVDYIVAALAITVCACLSLGGIVPLITGGTGPDEWNKELGEMVTDMMDNLLNVVAMFVGAKIQQGRDRHERQRDTEHAGELATIKKGTKTGKDS